MADLKIIIENAASEFALVIVNAIQEATFQEIVALQGGTGSKRLGRPRKAAAGPVKKKRHINYPKCSVPGCGKNRYARGNGMCGDHFRALGAGKGKAAKKKA